MIYYMLQTDTEATRSHSKNVKRSTSALQKQCIGEETEGHLRWVIHPYPKLMRQIPESFSLYKNPGKRCASDPETLSSCSLSPREYKNMFDLTFYVVKMTFMIWKRLEQQQQHSAVIKSR